MREIGIIDTTLRDAHQCLWARRMTTAMMMSVAQRMDHMGFAAVDVYGTGQFDVGVRYLKEDPWEKLRLLCRTFRQTRTFGFARSRLLTGFDVVPDDLLLLWAERLIANGLKSYRVFDPLNNLDAMVPLLRRAKALGAHTTGVLTYGLSPVHTDAFYAQQTQALIARAGVDSIVIKDAGGLLTPDRIRTLIPAVKQAAGSVPLELHGHCTTGLAPLVYHEAAKLGADLLHTSIAPLANGTAQPATQTMVRNLRGMGFRVGVDDALVDEVGAHLRRIALHEGKPLGEPVEYDAFHFEHQVPGGMQAHLVEQLTQAGLADRLPEVLLECARVRRELGWPIMITPFSQFVGTQATLNVVHGERYRFVPDEVKKYALGYFGKLVAPVDPDVLDRIVENGAASIPLEPVPLAPAVPALRRKYPNMSDEERLLRYSYAGTQVDDMLAAGPLETEYRFERPLVRLLRELAERPRVGRVYVECKALRLEVGAAEQPAPA